MKAEPLRDARITWKAEDSAYRLVLYLGSKIKDNFLTSSLEYAQQVATDWIKGQRN